MARILEPDDGSGLQHEDLATASWTLSHGGTILRHRFEMTFRRADPPVPADGVETAAMTVVLGLLLAHVREAAADHCGGSSRDKPGATTGRV